MATEWFVRVGDAEHGPFSSDVLKQLALKGKVVPDTPVKKGTDGHWVRAIAVKGLFPVTNHTQSASAYPHPNASKPTTSTTAIPAILLPTTPISQGSATASHQAGGNGKRVEEYRRTCCQCGTVWHSLKSREKRLENDQCSSQCMSCSSGIDTCGTKKLQHSSASGTWGQWKGNAQALDTELCD